MEDDFAGSHAAPVRSTAGEGFDARDLRNALLQGLALTERRQATAPEVVRQMGITP